MSYSVSALLTTDRTMSAARRIGLWLLILTLGAGAASSLSIFDVIQLSKKGYTDEEIVALIEATDSLFELQAEDLPRLKQLGVSETVIRAMLQRVPEETTRTAPAGETPVDRASVAEATDEHEHTGEAPAAGISSDRSAAVRPVDPRRLWKERSLVADPAPESYEPSPAPSIRAYQDLVSFYPVQEERAGGHQHMALTLSGLEVLLLRDEGAFPSMQARALEVTQRLDAAWTQGDGTFFAVLGARGPKVAKREQRLAPLWGALLWGGHECPPLRLVEP